MQFAYTIYINIVVEKKKTVSPVIDIYQHVTNIS